MNDILKLIVARGRAIDFDEPLHKYTLKTDKKLKFTSGTTFIAEHHPHFDSQRISTKLAGADEIKKAELLCAWACSSHKGTFIHRITELYVLAMMEQYHFPAGYKNSQVEALVDYIYSFLHSGWKLLVPELIIWDRDYEICGTADLILYNDKNEIMIVDYKTCKRIDKESFDGKMMYDPISHIPDSKFYHYALQLSLYQHMLEKNTGCKVVNRILLQSSENGNKALIPVPYLESEIKKMLEIRQMLK